MKSEVSLQEDGLLVRIEKVHLPVHSIWNAIDIDLLLPWCSVWSFINIAGDLSELGQLYSISLDDFERDILPDLQEHDSVIWFDCKFEDAANKSDETQLHAIVEK